MKVLISSGTGVDETLGKIKSIPGAMLFREVYSKESIVYEIEVSSLEELFSLHDYFECDLLIERDLEEDRWAISVYDGYWE